MVPTGRDGLCPVRNHEGLALTFFTYGTSVSGTPNWTFAGERGDLMRARDEKAVRRYVFAAPSGSVILVR